MFMSGREFSIGEWNCTVSEEDSKLTCEKEGPQPDTVFVEEGGDAFLFTHDKSLKFPALMGAGNKVELDGESGF